MSTAPRQTSEEDRRHMAQALELARQGEGRVEPNPMVGCVIVRDGKVVGEAWHQQFGGPHAEAAALEMAGEAARGATAYVTLEPCAHHGKTPPCTEAILQAGIARVVAGCRDPNPTVTGGGTELLQKSGVHVDFAEAGLAREAADLIAPFAKLATRGRPWVIAKWAMTLDGKIAASDGSSRWISSEESRGVVHEIRGRVDAVLIGRGTAQRDDPLLTARPQGVRTPVRVIADSLASLSTDSQLVRTVSVAPVLVAAGPAAPNERVASLRAAGVEVLQLQDEDSQQRLASLLDILGQRRWTNLLAEGGAALLGSLLDLGEIDEVHALVAPKVVGGSGPSPVAGAGAENINAALLLHNAELARLGGDSYLHGRLSKPN